MFRYLGEKIPLSDTDSGVYRCEVRHIFCTVLVCFVLFLIGVTAVRCIINTFCCHSGMKEIKQDSPRGSSRIPTIAIMIT